MKKILLIGATGLVGQSVLKQALENPQIDSIVALTRHPLPEHTKLNNIIVNFDDLPSDAPWWQVDAVICTLGTTIRKAGSQQNFRKIDFDYPYYVGQLARTHNVNTYVINTAVGANPDSKVFYSRTKGDVEQALISLNFPSFTTVRPSFIDGNRIEFRLTEKISLFLLKVFSPLIPVRYRSIHADLIAKSLLNAAIEAKPGVNMIESEQIR